MTASAVPEAPSPTDVAAGWIARLHAEDRTPEDDAAFRQWLAEDPANLALFDKMVAIWTMAAASGTEPPEPGAVGENFTQTGVR